MVNNFPTLETSVQKSDPFGRLVKLVLIYLTGPAVVVLVSLVIFKWGTRSPYDEVIKLPVENPTLVSNFTAGKANLIEISSEEFSKLQGGKAFLVPRQPCSAYQDHRMDLKKVESLDFYYEQGSNVFTTTIGPKPNAGPVGIGNYSDMCLSKVEDGALHIHYSWNPNPTLVLILVGAALGLIFGGPVLMKNLLKK